MPTYKKFYKTKRKKKRTFRRTFRHHNPPSAVFLFPRQPQANSIREITRDLPPADRRACQDKELMEDGNELSMSRVVCFVPAIPARCFEWETNERENAGRRTILPSLVHSCLMVFAVGLEKRRSIKVREIGSFARHRWKAHAIGISRTANSHTEFYLFKKIRAAPNSRHILFEWSLLIQWKQLWSRMCQRGLFMARIRKFFCHSTL